MAYKQSPFKMAGFSGFGNSPMKQVSGKDYPYHAKYNPSGKKFLDVAKKTTGTVESAGITHEVGTLIKDNSKGVTNRTVSNISKHIPKIVKGAGKLASKAFLPLTIAETMYSFGKTSVERKKAGLSGFNFPKPPTPKKGKGFTF